MRIINLTPHMVYVRLANGEEIRFPSAGSARIHSEMAVVETIDDVPIFEKGIQSIEGLPPEVEGTIYIVSSVLKMYLPDRKDLVVPALVSKVENACRGFWR